MMGNEKGITHLLCLSNLLVITSRAIRCSGSCLDDGGTLLPPNIAAAAASVSRFGDDDAGLKIGVAARCRPIACTKRWQGTFCASR